MKCSKCGNEINNSKAFCPKCGEPLSENTGKKIEPVKAIIAIALIISLLTITLVCCSAARHKTSQADAFRNKLMQLTEKPIIEFCCDDFNTDHIEEAFAVVGTETDYGFTEAEIWFVSEEAGEIVKDDFSGRFNGILEAEEMKYISVEVNDEEKGTSASFIYGVEAPDKYFEPEVSGKYSGVHQDGDRIITADGEEIKILRNQKHTLAESPEEKSEPTEATEAAKPKYSAEDIANIYYDNMDTWQVKDAHLVGYPFYSFVDLDFDGILELVVSHTSGTAHISMNSYYTVDPDTKTVKRLENTQEPDGQLNWKHCCSEDNLKLYKGSDGMFYFGTDGSYDENNTFCGRYQKITRKGSDVYAEVLFSTSYEPNGGSRVYYYEADNGSGLQSISKSEYGSQLDKFTSENTDMNLKTEGFEKNNFDDLSSAEKKEKILKAYKSFSYDGFNS